jgi:uroporphyrinogen-III synthase
LGVVSFTSPSTVKNLVERLEGASLDALRAAVITTVGPTTADACREVGLEPAVVPERPGGLALVAALVAWARENPDEVVRLRDQQEQAADQSAVSKESK